MKASASPSGRGRAGPKSWRKKIALSVRVAPLGLGCALVLYLISLEIDRGFGFLNQLQSSAEPVPMSETEHTLAAVHTSMVELPGEGDARAIAHFVTSTRMATLENRQLRSVMRKLETQYAGLVRRSEANLAKQQENLADTQSELRRLQDRLDEIATQVDKLAVKDEFTAWPKQSDGRVRYLTPEASKSEDAVDKQLGLASAVRNDFVTETATSRSWISNTDLPLGPSVRFAALQIARSLDNTRREALRTKLERIFTIDVETRVLGGVLGSKLLQLDPALKLSLVTASSEVNNERSGRIRFFPDGTSTGGRIQVQHDSESATVNVDWSTGVGTIQVNGD